MRRGSNPEDCTTVGRTILMTRSQVVKGVTLLGLGVVLAAGCTTHTSSPGYYGTSSSGAYRATPNPVYPTAPGTTNNPTGLNSSNPAYTPPPAGSTTYPAPPSGTIVNPDGTVTTVPQR